MCSRGTAAAAAFVMAAGSVSWAGDLRIHVPGSAFRNSYVGGEFHVNQMNGSFIGVTGLYADQFLSDNTGGTNAQYAVSPNGRRAEFATFCLEFNEYLPPQGETVSATINTYASMGNIGSSGGKDYLDARTAYLYHSFRHGTLTGFDTYNGTVTGPAAGRPDSGQALQYAIWFLEQERTMVQLQSELGVAVEAKALAFIAAANAAVAPATTLTPAGAWFGMGIGNVRVLNYTYQNGMLGQSQLTIIPLPTAGGMSIAGLLTVLAVRRRVRL